MSTPFWQSPHEGATPPGPHAPNAALLIDFDNVTMGMRSDLAKELKSLLDSDIIKGKVTVQRAYADWRRYPQYIVPLSEASIDLIFAPAYGSSKKNATDIRMAIDGMELVFIRPEIGTFILLTGDSDFSSLVLKLKEYGKYVIGIGIQESSSDILVQNCDEYYSYTSISGLRKTTDTDQAALDPWVAVEQSLKRMVSRGDVMRSDRLKQVMLEIDPGFDEKSYGFSKFSRFLAEASSKGLISLKKLENGQYEVGPPKGDRKSDRGRRSEARRGRRDKAPRKDRKGDRAATEVVAVVDVVEGDAGGDPLANAYAILREALSGFPGGGHDGIRDSDVKRKILAMNRGFDETELGFAKFSRFLKQAHEHGVIVLNRRDSGNYEVTLGDGVIAVEAAESGTASAAEAEAEPRRGRGRRKKSDDGATPPKEEPAASEAPAAAAEADAPDVTSESTQKSRGRAVGARRGSQGKRRGEGAPPLLEGQVVKTSGGRKQAQGGGKKAQGGASKSSSAFAGMGLPTEPDAIVRYLTEQYKGVGQKTAESLVEAFGPGLFTVFKEQPERVAEVAPRRAAQVLEAWNDDIAFRIANAGPEGAVASKPSSSGSGRRRGRGTRRGTGRRKGSDS